MRLSLHTIICCCVFTTVLPLLKGATGETNTSMKKRSRPWLQSHVKRDLATADGQRLEILSGPLQDGHAKTLSPPSSLGLNKRPKRSKTSGCFLVTCLYHDLIHDLLEMNNNQEKTSAPEEKIGRNGYGRRRRSLLDPIQLVLHTGTHRWSTETGQRVSNPKSTNTVA
ncbi:ADM isoform X2 [Archocentrus centrarchus]|uniref:ADM isoform X2 n=1 Tax=Archocentrus centrarchus TaxID=63155 RepID=UPI0011EA36F5|nr:ADM-like isoform X2 [Archocentrus centrarchus]